MFRAIFLLALLSLCTGQQPSQIREPEVPEEPPTKEPLRVPASYWISYSQKALPGHPLIFQVQIFNGSSPVDVLVTLKDYEGQTFQSVGPVAVKPGGPQDISMEIPLNVERPKERYYGDQSYLVQISGRGSEVNFKEEGHVTLSGKSLSIFVQTDKAMYKPSHKVQFRVLAMTPDMKVLRGVKQDIDVTDAKGNLILQYRGVEAPKEDMGVIQKSFKLASKVPTGIWKIKVTIEGVEKTGEFEVSDYVLPRFEVQIDGPSYGVITDPLYEFSVSAEYTFGKPVTKGGVEVHITLKSWSQMPIIPIIKMGKLDADGKMKVMVTRRELIALAQQYFSYYTLKDVEWKTFNILANVTEEMSGNLQSASHEVTFYKSPLEISFLGITPGNFKSGLDFTAYIQVVKKDGSSLSPEYTKRISVLVNVTYDVLKPQETTTTTTALPLPSNDNGTATKEPEKDQLYPHYYYPETIQKELKLEKNEYPLTDDGWIVVTFRVPDEARRLYIQAKTKSSMEDVQTGKSIQKSYSPSDSFLQLSVINKKVQVGDIVTVQAKATDVLKLLNYQVFSKGLLLSSKAITSSERTMKFEFQATATMSPSMSIVAFYVRDDGEFVVDALSLSVDGLFNNAVSIDFSKKKVQPGEAVDAIVSGEQGSVVFLLGVDKSVKLLKSGNDITQDMVREELAGYDYGHYGFWRFMFVCGWPSYFGGSNAGSVLSSAGVQVKTDGLIYTGTGNDGNLNARPDPEFDAAQESTSADKVSSENDIATRKNFPESWLWTSLAITKENGKVVIPMVSPDTITTWVATAFSVNPVSGLSVAAKPAEVTTFIDLFISVDLPTSIVRYEEFCFPATVFSYFQAEIAVILTLDKNPDFENIYLKRVNNEVTLNKANLYYSFFMGFMKENQTKTVTFCFSPNKIGPLTLNFTAKTSNDGIGDRVQKVIQVKPEGVPRATALPHLVELTNGQWVEDVAVQFPADTVEGSERISVNIAGNLLGPIFDNLEDLLRKPYGCGEQNMINFSPIMSLLDFFYTSNTITDEIREKAVDYMLIGYQKEILYEHGNSGGFSTFGNSDTEENPSMWLTAFVTKCFAQAKLLDKKYPGVLAMNSGGSLTIDTQLIIRSSYWMLNQQARNGSFIEKGRVFNKGLQGGSGDGISLSAYTLIALHYSAIIFKDMPSESLEMQRISFGMDNVKRYLEMHIERLDDPYDVCITAYALNLVGSGRSDDIFAKMESMAKKGFGMMYWERAKPKTEVSYYWSRNTDGINIEMTSYALLTYSLRGMGASSGLPIVRWLSKKKGPNGGFVSTQDTVIGIEALTSIAKELYGSEFVPMTIEVSSIGERTSTKTFQISKENEMILQRQAIPFQAGDNLQLRAKTNANLDSSKSTVLIDVVLDYNTASETQPSGYDFNYKIIENRNGGFGLDIDLWTVDGKNASMTIVEVQIPIGFFPGTVEETQKQNPNISLVEIKDDLLSIYFDSDTINGTKTAINLQMMPSAGKPISTKPKEISVYNYYEPDQEVTKMYSWQSKNKDICQKIGQVGICQFF